MESKSIKDLTNDNIKNINDRLDSLNKKAEPDLDDLFEIAALDLNFHLIKKPSSAIKIIAADNGDLFDKEIKEIAEKKKLEKLKAKSNQNPEY